MCLLRHQQQIPTRTTYPLLLGQELLKTRSMPLPSAQAAQRAEMPGLGLRGQRSPQGALEGWLRLSDDQIVREIRISGKAAY